MSIFVLMRKPSSLPSHPGVHGTHMKGRAVGTVLQSLPQGSCTYPRLAQSTTWDAQGTGLQDRASTASVG